MHPRAGEPALPEDLVDIDALITAYYDVLPDPREVSQRVAFGTSGHRGSSLDGAFNESHIVAITAAIVAYRREEGVSGPLFLGRDPHALSHPAWQTALEVLAAAGVETMIDARDGYTPTPAISHAIRQHNAAAAAAVANAGANAGANADGIVVTPSHNPPRDGGFKYNPPHGGPADTEATRWIADRANRILGRVADVPRIGLQRALAAPTTHRHDYLAAYVEDLDSVIDIAAIRDSGLRVGADPLGGAAVDYWGAIAERLDLDVTVVNPRVDPRWDFMTLDWDGKIRMDCSSPSAMAALVRTMAGGPDVAAPYAIATGNDADADRHGIVTPDGGLMNPNHYLAVAVDYLFGGYRPGWPDGAAVGKTLVSSALIDRVAAAQGRRLLEVPVGFKWFVPGLLDGSVGFGGEESAGASLLRRDGTAWTTDKDGIALALLASEITARTGKSPTALHRELVERHGQSWYQRIDAPASREQKAALAALTPDRVGARTLAGERIIDKLTEAPGNGAAIGGLKVVTENAWFAARPSGTEDVYKIYAESFRSAEHLVEVQAAARELVARVVG